MIYLFLADGFEEIEALTTVDILRRAGCSLATVGVGRKRITGSHHIEVTADLEIGEADLSSPDMVILPGGPGHKNLEKSSLVLAAVQYCADHDKYIAAICAAPSILGHMGLLKNHTATCFPGYEEELHAKAVSKDAVCVSGKIITGKGAGVTVDFALKIVEVLYGAEKSNTLRKNIQCM
jgi:DJ-1 family protein